MKVKQMQENADKAEALLKAMASRNRLMILCTLVEGERSVGALAKALGVRESVISQHLGLLRRDGLVQGRRDGFVRLFCQDETRNRAPFKQPFQPHSCSTG